MRGSFLLTEKSLIATDRQVRNKQKTQTEKS